MKPFKEAEGYGDDLQAAYDYYKCYGIQSAERFLAAYEKGIGIIRASPYVCRVRTHGWRQLVIHAYPNYSIFYRELHEFWLLGGILCTVQDPDSILVRLLIREAIQE
jgi:plasmid stabilization system protein ParE